MEIGTLIFDSILTEDATESLHEETNSVTVEYSHEPSVLHDGNGKKIGDKTHHYSFTIDGDIWGDSQTFTQEVVKVGIDKNGEEITQSQTLINGKQIGALGGAEFKLYTNEACTQEYNKGAYATNKKIVSFTDGRLSLDGTTAGIPGLDACQYCFVETKAPDGYIRQQESTKIEIIPTVYSTVEWTEGTGNGAVTYSCDDLMKSYVVKVDDETTATYTLRYENMNADETAPLDDTMTQDTTNMYVTHAITIGNTGPITEITSNQDDTDDDGKIKNTQGVELPSTGGIGTTLFYTIGAILVIGAGIVLITRRRMSIQ